MVTDSLIKEKLKTTFELNLGSLTTPFPYSSADDKRRKLNYSAY